MGISGVQKIDLTPFKRVPGLAGRIERLWLHAAHESLLLDMV